MFLIYLSKCCFFSFNVVSFFSRIYLFFLCACIAWNLYFLVCTMRATYIVASKRQLCNIWVRKPSTGNEEEQKIFKIKNRIKFCDLMRFLSKAQELHQIAGFQNTSHKYFKTLKQNNQPSLTKNYLFYFFINNRINHINSTAQKYFYP